MIVDGVLRSALSSHVPVVVHLVVLPVPILVPPGVPVHDYNQTDRKRGDRRQPTRDERFRWRCVLPTTKSGEGCRETRTNTRTGMKKTRRTLKTVFDSMTRAEKNDEIDEAKSVMDASTSTSTTSTLHLLINCATTACRHMAYGTSVQVLRAILVQHGRFKPLHGSWPHV